MAQCMCCKPMAYLASMAESSGAGVRRPPSAGAVDPALLGDLVAANRILAAHNVLDGYGHVSLRHPANPDHFLLSRSLAPASVCLADIMEFASDCEPVAGESRGAYLERYIHGEIYRARHDVMAIVHSHSPSVIPFGLSQTKMQAVFHMSAFLAQGVPIYDVREHFGDTDLLVSSRAMGAKLAQVLADKPMALMRGHGNVAVGRSIPEAVYRAIYTEVNAQMQLQAQALQGPLIFVNAAEGAKADATVMPTISRPWDLWKAQVTIE